MQSHGLANVLRDPKFRCTAETCKWHGDHPMKFQEDKNKGHDFAKIPDQLAELVARTINDILNYRGVPHKPYIEISKEMQEDFIKAIEAVSEEECSDESSDSDDESSV